MSLSGHVHHFALVISIYDLVIFIDDGDSVPHKIKLNDSVFQVVSDQLDNFS